MSQMKKILAILMVVTVVLAGCVGGYAGLSGNSEDGKVNEESNVNLYISDEPNDIKDFKHLNVTITKVGFKKVNSSTEASATANATAESETWITYDVDDKEVDLTTLHGANATLLSEFDLPNGTYEKVFVYVSEIDATLKNNESTRVKLPSQKLHVNKKFTVNNSESVDFVFDISVHKAGKSGKYILKPVVSESGVDVPMNVVGQEEGDDEDEDEEERELEGEIEVSVEGNVSAGEEVTVRATQNGSAVSNATVEVNGEVVGETGSNGEITVTVPSEEEFEVEVEAQDEAEGELEIILGDDEEEDDEGEDEERDEDDSKDRDNQEQENETDDENEETEENNNEDNAGDNTEDSSDDGEQNELEGNININVKGEVLIGEDVTLKATHNGSAVSNATVKVNGEVVGKTDSNGEITITVPTATELEVEIVKGDAEGSIEIEL